MAVKKSGLGKGLDSLIPKQTGVKRSAGSAAADSKDSSAKTAAKTPSKKEPEPNAEMKLKLTQIEPNRDQPRKNFDEDALVELADSIRQFGVIQPLIVQKKGDYYEIIAGERRWRAAKLAGLKEVPVIIREFSGQQAVEISLIENIQRENLNPIEEAVAYKRLLNEFNLTQEEVADRVSKSRTAVTNSMRLLKLDERVQQMVIEGKLSTGHARALLAITDPEIQYQCAQEIFNKKLSVRDVEHMVKVLSTPEKEKPKPDDSQDFIYQNLEERMKALLGTKVSIDHRNQNKGRIVIDYYSNEELERLMYLFQSLSGREN